MPGFDRPLILLAESGSRIHEMHHAESDHDRQGIFVAPTREVLGLSGVREESAAWQDARGDVTVHEVGKFCRLAIKGNPTLLNLLWVGDEHIFEITDEGRDLRAMRRAFLHRHTLASFIGYAKAQLKLFLKGRSVHTTGGRPTGKWAAHLMRLVWQGEHLARTGDLILAFDAARTAELRRIRFGDVPADLAEMASAQIAAIEAVIDGHAPTPLPDAPDAATVNEWLLAVRARHWPDLPG